MFGERNKLRDTILEYAWTFDLVIANIYLKQIEGHLITYKSETNKSQTFFYLENMIDLLVKTGRLFLTIV